MSTTSSKRSDDQTTYQPTFYDPSVNKNVGGQSSMRLHRSTTTQNGGTTSTRMMVSSQASSAKTSSSSSPDESRQRARRGAASRCNVERGPKREHLFTSAKASGDLLSPNWLSGHHVLEPLFGLIAF